VRALLGLSLLQELTLSGFFHHTGYMSYLSSVSIPVYFGHIVKFGFSSGLLVAYASYHLATPLFGSSFWFVSPSLLYQLDSRFGPSINLHDSGLVGPFGPS